MIDPEDHAAQVEYHARRVAATIGRPSDLDDYRQDAWLGLLEAEGRYVDGTGAQLKTFARGRIRGQIIDGIRSRHFFGVRASRAHRDLVTISLDAPLVPAPQLQYTPDLDGDIAREERIRAVRSTLDALPAPQAQILRMHYLEDVTLEEIARRLGMSLSNTSRIHVQALRMFRGRWLRCMQG